VHGDTASSLVVTLAVVISATAGVYRWLGGQK